MLKVKIKILLKCAQKTVKNNCCLFERLFKVKKNGVFLFGIFFSVLEIFTCMSLHYANEESDDVMSGSIKAVHQHSIKNISRGIKTVFLKTFTPEMFITNETRWHPSCHCHGNSYAAGTLVIKTKIVRFYLELESSTPNNLVGRVKTMNHVCCEQDPLSHLKRLQWRYFVFHRKGQESRVLPWQ